MKRSIYYLEHKILDNIEIVDSPGTGSRNLNHTVLAKKLMREAHAVILITEAVAPLERQDEIEFLDEIIKAHQSNDDDDGSKKLFIVANKQDLSQKSPEKIRTVIKDKLDEEFEGDLTTSNIYSISAKKGYNLKEFYVSLSRFLIEDKNKAYVGHISRMPESYLKSIINDLKNDEEEIHETLKSVENQIRDFRNQRNELQRTMRHKLTEFDIISMNADKPAINGGLEITSELQRSKTKNTTAFKNKIKNAFAIYKKNKKFWKKKSHKERLQNDINMAVRKNMETIYLDTAQNVIENLKPKIEKAQNIFIDDVQKKIELVSDRYNLSSTFKIDALDALAGGNLFEDALGGFLASGILTSLVGTGWLTLALLSSVGFPPLWPFAAVIATGSLLGAAVGAFDDDLMGDIVKKFNKSFNHSYTDKKITRPPLKEFLKTEILKNIVNKNIQKIKQINKNNINEQLDKIENNLEIKLLEKQKVQKNSDIIKQNQEVLLKEIEAIKSDFDRLKSSSLFA